MRSTDLILFTVAFLAAVIVASFVPLPWEWGAFLSVIAISIGLVAYRRQSHRYACIVSIAAALGVLRMSLIPTGLPQAFVPFLDTKIELRGTVVRLPDVRESSNRLAVKIEKEGVSTRIIASAPLYPPVHVGDEVLVSGTLTSPEPFATDGGRTFKYDQFLRKDGVFALVQPAHVEVTGTSVNPWLRFLRLLEAVKGRFMEALDQALPEPESALASGLIVGGKQGLGKELIEAFTVSGMLQIVVLSGYNVMIIADHIFRALSKLPKRIASWSAGIVILCFVLAAGAGASALRAGIMAVFAIIARATGKTYQVVRILVITLLLLTLWNPLLVAFDPGFQFSFLATLGLIIGTPLLDARLTRIKSSYLREAVATTLAAQIGVLPLLLWQTGSLSLVAVFANVLVMPVIPFAMGTSALAALLAFPLGMLSSFLPLAAGIPAYLSLSYIIHVATLSALLPFSHLILPSFPFWLVLASYASLALLVTRIQGRTPMPDSGIGVLRRSPLQ